MLTSSVVKQYLTADPSCEALEGRTVKHSLTVRRESFAPHAARKVDVTLRLLIASSILECLQLVRGLLARLLFVYRGLGGNHLGVEFE